jgi:MFS family permease
MDFTKVYSPLMLSSAVFLLFIMKTATTTLFRGIYPFAEYFAADMGIPVGRFFLVLSFGELLGAVSPLLGPLAERVGPRRMLLINGATNAAFGVLVGLGLSTFGLFVAAWCMYCVAKTMLFSSGGAFIGTFVPKQWRTRATGVAEISWGIASFVGLPFIGFIVSVAPYGWMMYSMSIFMAMGVGLMYVVLRWGSRDPTSGAPDSSLPIVAVTVDASDQPETKGFDRVSPEPNSEFKLIPVTTTVEKRHVATDESKQESSMENGRSRRKLDRIGASARYLRPKRCSPQLGIFKVVLKDKSAWCLLVTCIIAITCTSVMFTNYCT